MYILGIETSCDETAIAICDLDGKIHAHHLYSQIEEHKKFGGVVPEKAARSHLTVLPSMLKEITSTYSKQDICAVAATVGPGLIGGLLVGASLGLGFAASQGIPFFGIHHVDAHIFLIHKFEDVHAPYYAYLLSGGHTLLACVNQQQNDRTYTILGETLDDSLGETFDKVSKMLGLSYPGGPIIEKLATKGNPYAFSFPIPMEHSKTLQFSFSGLKSAVYHVIKNIPNLDQTVQQDIAASFQYTIGRILLNRLNVLYTSYPKYPLVAAGGVLSNKYLRNQLQQWCLDRLITLHLIPQDLCTDNGIMIVYKGLYEYNHYTHFKRNKKPLKLYPRWSLEALN